MNKKEELIKQCRYYKGEKECPFDGEKGWFWDMERVYVSHDGEFDGEQDYYERIRGKKYTDMPFAMLIAMFTSWGKYTYDIANEIDNFYGLIDKYLAKEKNGDLNQ